MGYTTDANYLLQASKDIAVEVGEADATTADFEGGSELPWHEWGEYAAALHGPYQSARASMLACMVRVGTLLDAHADALKQAGDLYLGLEEAATHRLGGIR
ncbi:hypothetical protein [Actinophytocola gossypii]|uniref:ESX-1 secretion-associated protein n=1 Tax=Actinophytocola gossypii TaxID=2812003 RepID=A0ABT2J4R7_9PSEU|nr:hypothetical protein [Actinophytocola gossypii]MCT2582845.1 hypothetical protein [Actinophytocola gossypii]